MISKRALSVAEIFINYTVILCMRSSGDHSYTIIIMYLLEYEAQTIDFYQHRYKQKRLAF